MSIKRFKPKSPDKKISKLKGNATFARLSDLNDLVDQVNSIPSPPALPYKSYVAKLIQTGTNDPELQEICNNTGIVVNWTRANTGVYEAILTGYTMGADSGRVTITCSPGEQLPVGITIFSSLYDNAGTMKAKLITYANYTGAFIGSTGPYDSLLNNATVEIRIYN